KTPAGFNVHNLNVASINNKGLMAATAYGNSDGLLRSFILNPSGAWPSTVAVAGASSTLAHHINDKGEVTGTALFSSFIRSRGFIRSGAGSTYRVFYVPNQPTEGGAMNDAGLRAGTYYDAAGHAHGFRSNNWAQYLNIDYDPYAAESFVLSTNNSNDFVGYL